MRSLEASKTLMTDADAYGEVMKMDKNVCTVLDPRGQPSGIFGKALSPENEMMDFLNPV